MVSIIMPAYNAEPYIRGAIESVLAQTVQDWELLIIDDCSVDQTAQISLSYAKQDKRIHYLKNHINSGAAESRNRGITHANGEWIAFLDSDDCWDRKKLQLQLQAAAKHKAVFLFTGSSFINEHSQPLDAYLPAPDQVRYKDLLKQNVISCSSVLIRKELISQYPMKHAARLHEDFAVWLQILRDKQICAYGVDAPLLIYRVTSGSKSGNKIKAGIMTFRVYRYVGLGMIPAVYYWGQYFYRSLKKYRFLMK